MSSFFIRVEDGAPVGNPMPLSAARSLGFFESGFQNGEIPEGLEKFKPVRAPFFEWNQVLETDGELHKVDGVWQRTYHVRPMSPDELQAHKDSVIAEWNAGEFAYPSWSYNEETGQMSPPVHPDGIKNPVWDEATQSWSGDPLGPDDAKVF